MSNLMPPDDNPEDPLQAVADALQELVQQFGDLVRTERESRREDIATIKAEAKRARRRDGRIIAVVLILILATTAGYYRNEQVIACDRSNNIRAGIRDVIVATVDEVGNYVELDPDVQAAIEERVKDRAESEIPRRDCHWWP